MDKFKLFIKEQKDVLLFLGVLLMVFGGVITFGNLRQDDPYVPTITDPDPEDPDKEDPDKEDPDKDKVVLEKMLFPIEGDYEIVRYYYDTNNPGILEDAVLTNGTNFVESNGIGFAKNVDADADFGVIAIYSGLVIDVGTSTIGDFVTIDHGDGIIATYHSLKEISVEVGDEVGYGQVFAEATYSSFDINAGLHVHLEIKVDGEFVNPLSMYNQEKEQYKK